MSKCSRSAVAGRSGRAGSLHQPTHSHKQDRPLSDAQVARSRQPQPAVKTALIKRARPLGSTLTPRTYFCVCDDGCALSYSCVREVARAEQKPAESHTSPLAHHQPILLEAPHHAWLGDMCGGRCSATFASAAFERPGWFVVVLAFGPLGGRVKVKARR